MALQVADTARALSAVGVSVARALPVAGRVFGSASRLELDGRVVFVTGAARRSLWSADG